MLFSNVVLPAPLRPTQGDDLALGHGHVDVEQNLRLAIGRVQALDGKDIIAGAHWAAASSGVAICQ